MFTDEQANRVKNMSDAQIGHLLLLALYRNVPKEEVDSDIDLAIERGKRTKQDKSTSNM